MIVLHIAPINTSIVNGFRFSVPGIVSAQKELGIESALFNIEKPELFSVEKLEKKHIKIFQGKPFKLNELEKPFNQPDIVILHGVYRREYLPIYKQLIKKNIPYVVVPRVSLTKGAQEQKKMKKKISNYLFFNKMLKHASAVQYLTKNEKKLSSSFGLKNFVAGNGIDLPKLENKISSRGVNLSFIGRYDINHKGLDVLIHGINDIKGFLRSNKVKVNFYGSDFKDGRNYLLEFVEDHEIEDIVNINEAVFGESKEIVLRNTNVFLATSRFEGHPMAVIEAMSYGIPCVLTKGTNMLGIMKEYDAGWGTELKPDEIANSIIKAVQNPKDIYRKGLNARHLIEKNYTWDKIAEKTILFYEKIIKKESYSD